MTSPAPPPSPKPATMTDQQSLKPLPPPTLPSLRPVSDTVEPPSSFSSAQQDTVAELNGPPPSAYSHHLAALINQSLTTAQLSPDAWAPSLTPAIVGIPFSSWVDELARTQREHPHRRPRPTSSTPSSTAPPPPPPRSSSESNLLSGSTESAVHLPTPPKSDSSTSASLSSFVERIPMFLPYPASIDDDLDPQENALYSPARRRVVPRHVPGAFPGPASPLSPRSRAEGRPSMDSIASAASESDPAESAAHERAELKGKRVVLGVSIWVVEKREGDLDRIEWVQGRWAVDKSHNHQHASPQASSTAATDATFDGMPSGDSGANLLTMSAVVPPKESSESTASTASTAAAGEGKGKVIFGLDRLDQSVEPEAYHLVGGTLVIHGAPDASTLGALEKVIRIGIYTHLSNALELSLLVAHSRTLDPPAPVPTLFERFPPPTERSSSASINEVDGEHHWQSDGTSRKRFGAGGKWSKSWGGLLGALVGGGKSHTKKGRFGLGLGSVDGGERERPFSTLSTVMVDRPDSETTSAASHASSTMTSTRDGLLTPTVPATPSSQPGMDKFTKACLTIQSTIFSTSPNVSFPPPPLLVRLREAESRAALAPAATTSSFLARQDASAVAMEFGGDGQALSADKTTVTAADVKRLGESGPGGFRLTGEARAGMGSLMVGNGSLAAFGRHQSISVLYQVLPLDHPSLAQPSAASRPNSPAPLRSPLLMPTTPITPTLPNSPQDPLSLATSPAASISDAAAPSSSAVPSCVHPSWRTLSYFSSLASAPESASPSLGGLIRSYAVEAKSRTVCAAAGCTKYSAEGHKRIWMHAGARVLAGVKVLEVERDLEKEALEEAEGVLVDCGRTEMPERIDCWVECVECGAKSDGRWMSEAAGLFSFAKYLELLIYADSGYPKDLCAHTRASPTFFSPASTAHTSPIVRHFRHAGVVVSFAVDVFDIFELKLGKLMVSPSSLPRHTVSSMEGDEREQVAVRELLDEIEAFYVGIEKRLGTLKSHLLGPVAPATVSPDSSPKTSDPPPLPPKEPSSPVASASFASLRKLSVSIRQDESAVRAALRTTSPAALNDARKVFVDKAKEAKARLESWEKRHASDLATLSIAKAEFEEPDFLSQRSIHLLPGSSVLLHEDEPASIIAHILASADYQRELAKLRPASGLFSQPTTPRQEEAAFTFRPAPQDKEKALPPSPPGSDDALADKASAPESWTLEITRPEPPRDLSAALLSLRAIAKKPSSGTLSLSTPGLLPPNRMGSLTSKGAPTNEPTVSLGEAAAKLTDEGKGSSLSVGGSAKILREKMMASGIDGTTKALPSQPLSHFFEPSGDSNSSSSSSSCSVASTPPPSFYNRPLSMLSGFSDFSITSSTSPAAREVTTSIEHRHERSMTASSVDSNATINPSNSEAALGIGHPSADASTSTTASAAATPSRKTTPPSAAPSSFLGGWGSGKDESWTSSLTSGIGSSLSSIIGMGTGSLRGKKEPAPRASSIHGLLSADHANTIAIEEKPHIQFSYAIGKKLTISCTVFFAASFDNLRRKLGVDEAIIESLSHAAKWDAQGGKSKALFFRTADQRYIVKELVTKWNVSDVQALLEIAPSYLDYMNGTATKPTALAKILGFYSVKMHNLETGTSTKRDLLVMENIFFDQDVSKTFDLKGIEGRRVKTSQGPGDTVGHDREWVEGQQKTLLVVHPHSKRILREAIAADAKFLSANSIVDFSLLVGVDEDKKELAVGLVDAIGAFTFFKALESKGKQLASKGLVNDKGAAGRVTVLPPDQYGARFEAAIDSYFIACPDKFSAPMVSSKSGAKTTAGVRKDFAVPSVF